MWLERLSGGNAALITLAERDEAVALVDGAGGVRKVLTSLGEAIAVAFPAEADPDTDPDEDAEGNGQAAGA